MIYDLQKASVLKRISAFLLDFILVCILATGFALLVSAIVDYQGKLDNINKLDVESVEKYNLQEILPTPQEGEDYTIYLSSEQVEKLEWSIEQEALFKQAHEYYKTQSGATIYQDYTKLASLSYLMISLGLFFANLILEFVVPLLFKNGRTVGKKVFGVGVMLINGVRISPVALFVRAMLGKYAIETMFPLTLALVFLFFQPNFFVFLIFVAIFIVQLVLIIATKNNSLIHDIISSTVTVDLSSQMIFDTYDDLIAYKEEIHRKTAEEQKY